MQFAKDSFYMALRSRLAALNPEHTVNIDGVSETAILIEENEPATSADKFGDCFYLLFGAAGVISDAGQNSPPLMSLEVVITYKTRGTADGSGDRGRSLAALDSELLAIFSPQFASKCDYTKDPAAELGTTIFWTTPHLNSVEQSGAEMCRTVKSTIYFYPEVKTT